MLSLDGAQLYVVGTSYRVEDGTDFRQTSLGLQMIDLATGEVSAEIDTDAQSLTVAPMHGRIFLQGWANDDTRHLMTEWTEVRDATTLELVDLIEGKAVTVAHRLDGTPILLATTTLQSGQTELALLDPQTFEVISSVPEPYDGYAGWVVLP